MQKLSIFIISLLLLSAAGAQPSDDKSKDKPKEASKEKDKAKKKGRGTAASEEDLPPAEDDFKVTTHATSGNGGAADAEPKELLNIITWRMKKGSDKVDVDRMANVIASADITVLQDVEFNERGETAVNVIGNILEKRASEKICRVWFKTAKGDRGRFAFLWREAAVGFVEKDGTMHDNCAARPFVLHSEAKDYGYATFYLKSNRKLFILTSIGLDSVPREREIPRYFRGYADSGWSIIFAGDLKTSTHSNGFNDVKRWSFKSALQTIAPKGKGVVRRLENIWFKNIALISASPVNLYEQFPEMSRTDVDGLIGQSFPIRAQFSFSEREAEEVQTQLISKKKSKGPASVEPPVVLKGPSYPAPMDPKELSNLKEDIESEASSTEPATAKPGRAKKKKKKK